MLSNEIGKRLFTYVKDYVVFDLETTGLSCDYDNVVEISAVKVIDGKAVDEYTTLVNPGTPIPYGATKINGITDEMVADSPTFDIALKAFMEFAGDKVLVGHNIHTFDMKFICRDALKYFDKTIGNDYVDTLTLSQIYLPELKGHKLVNLAEYYGLSSEGAHRALVDCHMNHKVYEHLADEIKNPSVYAQHIRLCPECGNVVILKNGRYGKFWGCTGYPKCRFTDDF